MIKVFKKEKSNIIAVTLQLLHKLKVRFNKSTIISYLESHPAYPGLLAISDCLASLHIQSVAYQVNLEDYIMSDLSFPFITHFSSDGGSFYLVEQTNSGMWRVSNEKKELLLTRSDFLESWEGIIFYASTTDLSGEKDYVENRIKGILKKITRPLFFILIVSLFVYLFNAHQFEWWILVLCLLKLSGITVSIVLLMNVVNANNPFVRKLCTAISKNDCNDLLQSKSARITSWLSWSEVGFFYFSGTFLILLISPILAPVLAWFNLLALPFTVYSFVFQYRTKNWCLLCCTIQVILVLECLVFNFNGGLQLAPMLQFHLILTLLLCLLLPIVTWALLKPVLLKASLTGPLKQQLKRFKNDSGIFKAILRNQEYQVINDELMPVIFGDPRAKTSITVVSNPFCSPCGQVHLLLEEWLQERDDLQLKIIFVNANKEEDLSTKVALHLLALNHLEDTPFVVQALNDWYKPVKKDYGTWAKKYPVIITNSVKAASAKQKHWCNKAEINFTPTIFINGYKLPELYQLEDIKYLLD